jgi:hypothetical protein
VSKKNRHNDKKQPKKPKVSLPPTPISKIRKVDLFVDDEPRAKALPADSLAARLALGREEDIQAMLELVSVSSRALAEEPEFADPIFLPSEVDAVFERTFAKAKKRLDAAMRKGPDAFQERMAETRIEASAQLLTPAVRGDILLRLEKCVRRLDENGKGTPVYETAFALQSLLAAFDGFPWETIGLIHVLIQRAMSDALTLADEREQIFGDILQQIPPGASLAEVMEIINKPENEAKLAEELEKNPQERARLQKQMDKAFDKFDKALKNGKIDLPLYKPEEFDVLGQYWEEALAERGITERPEVYIASLEGEELVAFLKDGIDHTILTIMTPERTQEMIADLREIQAYWSPKNAEWAIALEAAIAHLEMYAPEENTFLHRAFVAQMVKISKGQKP